MAFWNRWFRPRPSPQAEEDLKTSAKKSEPAAVATYNDKNITYTGDLLSYDYDSILRNKQANIIRLYELSDYFVDVDPIFRGIIKSVYTPFALADHYRLIGANERVKEKYEEYYERIHLPDLMRSIFLQYFKYANVVIYLMEDGSLITLPIHLIRIANVMVGGEPVVEFNCKTITNDLKQQGIVAQKDFVDDEKLEVRLDGFPKEVAEAVKKGQEWVQQNPDNTFMQQDLKEDWMRYAVPVVASCQKPFAKKALIADYESALQNLGICSFVHVSYGDAQKEILPDTVMLNQIQQVFASAMNVKNGVPLATTNVFCKAEVIQPDMNNMFEDDHYAAVNKEILSAGGISGIIVSGIAESGTTFGVAQVSIQTAAIRIKQARDNFCEMMNKINARLNGVLPHSNPSNIPKFVFPPVDLAGNEKFQKTCIEQWKEGVVSTETMLQTNGFDMGQEEERLKQEGGGIQTPAVNTPEKTEQEGKPGKPGRPPLDDAERNSDPAKSFTGKQPKPSNPEGSLPD